MKKGRHINCGLDSPHELISVRFISHWIWWTLDNRGNGWAIYFSRQGYKTKLFWCILGAAYLIDAIILQISLLSNTGFALSSFFIVCWLSRYWAAPIQFFRKNESRLSAVRLISASYLNTVFWSSLDYRWNDIETFSFKFLVLSLNMCHRQNWIPGKLDYFARRPNQFEVA